MSAVVTPMPTGKFRLARVVCFTDLTRSDSLVIPIAAVGEVLLPKLRGLGWAVRPHLEKSETNLLGPMLRDMLKDPAGLMAQALREAFEKATNGGALEYFGQRYHASISVLAPRPLELPKRWLIDTSKELGSIVKARMTVTLEDEYYDMLFPQRAATPVEEPRHDELMRKTA